MSVSKNEIKIIENFLEKEEFKEIKNFLTSGKFPWYISGIVAEEDCNVKEREHFKNTQFVHTFYRNYIPISDYLTKLNCIVEKIKADAWIRIKANLLTKTEKQIVHGMHTDTHIDCMTAIFYLNDNNGETIFENGKRIKSKENTFVSFPSKLKHSGTTNTCDVPFRIVLNLNYIKQ